MFDGVDAGADGVLDGLRAVRVRGDLRPSLWASSAMACISSSVYCGVPGWSPLLRTPPEAQIFDHVGAVLHGFADFGAGGPGTVGHAFDLK